MFSIVMPLVRYSYLLDKKKRKPSPIHNNIERFFRIGWKSLEHFINWDDVDTFFIIIPKVDYEEVVSKVKCAKIRIIFEEDLLKYPIQKYSIQMLSKLLISKYVKTTHYLVIDDDVILLRPFGYKDMFVHNKVRFTPDTTYNENWWRSSAIVLKMDYVKPKILMSVTPQILITSEVKKLINHLETLYDDWEYTMMTVKHRWSEYTLYWLYIDEKKLYRRSKIPLSDNATNIWFYNGNLKENIKKLFENKKQYFGVIQSNVPEHNYTVIEKEVKDYMQY